MAERVEDRPQCLGRERVVHSAAWRQQKVVPANSDLCDVTRSILLAARENFFCSLKGCDMIAQGEALGLEQPTDSPERAA